MAPRIKNETCLDKLEVQGGVIPDLLHPDVELEPTFDWLLQLSMQNDHDSDLFAEVLERYDGGLVVGYTKESGVVTPFLCITNNENERISTKLVIPYPGPLLKEELFSFLAKKGYLKSSCSVFVSNAHKFKRSKNEYLPEEGTLFDVVVHNKPSRDLENRVRRSKKGGLSKESYQLDFPALFERLSAIPVSQTCQYGHDKEIFLCDFSLDNKEYLDQKFRLERGRQSVNNLRIDFEEAFERANSQVELIHLLSCLRLKDIDQAPSFHVIGYDTIETDPELSVYRPVVVFAIEGSKGKDFEDWGNIPTLGVGDWGNRVSSKVKDGLFNNTKAFYETVSFGTDPRDIPICGKEEGDLFKTLVKYARHLDSNHAVVGVEVKDGTEKQLKVVRYYVMKLSPELNKPWLVEGSIEE